MKVKIIGVPMDLGADRRGVDMGPAAIRYAQLQKRLKNNGISVKDIGTYKCQTLKQQTSII